MTFGNHNLIFSLLRMFLLKYAKYHLANPIFIGAEGEGLAIEAKIYGLPPTYIF